MKKKILSLSMSNESAKASTNQSLSLYEQRFFWYSLAEFQFKNHFSNKKINEIKIPINDFHKKFKLNQINIYQQIKNVANKMSMIQFRLINNKKKEFEFYSVFPKFTYKNGFINIKLNEDIRSHFLNLKKNYFIAKLSIISNFKYKYTWFFYSYFKASIFNKHKGFVILSIKKIKKKLFLEKLNGYKKYGVFKQKIIKKAIEEINKKTELNVFYDEIKEHQKIIKIKFNIKNNN